jgi:hypothetical protein
VDFPPEPVYHREEKDDNITANQKESQNTGNVSWSVYKEFVVACNLPTGILFVIVLHLSVYSLMAGLTYFMSQWCALNIFVFAYACASLFVVLQG